MKKFKIFVIMPFDIEFNAIYKLIIDISNDPKFNQYFEVFRADDLLNQQNILIDIVESISNSNLIIAELTGLNPNVFYELGLSHGLKKDVILLTQDIKELPFDLKSYRVISYSTHFQKIMDFKKTLSKIFEGIINNEIAFSSPVSDFLTDKIPIEKQPIIKSNKKDSNNQLIDEKGILDFICDFQESSEYLNAIIMDFNKETIDLSDKINHNVSEIQKANINKSQGTFSQIRKIMHRTASFLDSYTNYVSKHNKIYEEKWSLFENGIINWLNSPRLDVTPDNVSELTDLLPIIQSYKDSMISAKDGIDNMAVAISVLKGIEKKINRASNLLENEIIVFSSLIDKSISTMDKVYNLVIQIKNRVLKQ